MLRVFWQNDVLIKLSVNIDGPETHHGLDPVEVKDHQPLILRLDLGQPVVTKDLARCYGVWEGQGLGEVAILVGPHTVIGVQQTVVYRIRAKDISNWLGRSM